MTATLRSYLAAGMILAAVSAGQWALAQEGAAVVPEAAAADAAEGGGPIFGDFDQTLPDAVFDYIAKQGGVELVAQDQVWANVDDVTMKVKGGYFWPVFMDLCKQANLRFQQDHSGRGQSRIQLYGAQQGGMQYDGLPQSISKGFVVMASSASRNFNISYNQSEQARQMSGMNRGNGFTIQLQVLVDPATPVNSWGQPLVTEAIDENGTSLLLARNDSGSMYGNNPGSLIQNVGVMLANPENIGKKLEVLKGSLRGSAVIKQEKVELDFPLPPEGKTIKTTESDITIQSISPRAAGDNAKTKQYELKIRVAPPAGDGRKKGGLRRGDNSNMWNLINTITIKDAQGKSLQVNGGGGNGDSDGSTTYTVSVAASGDAGDPAKLEWKLPIETRMISVPFEFKGLPIP